MAHTKCLVVLLLSRRPSGVTLTITHLEKPFLATPPPGHCPCTWLDLHPHHPTCSACSCFLFIVCISPPPPSLPPM